MFAVVALSGVLVAFLLALLVAVLVYWVGTYVLHAPQPVVGLIAFSILILILLVSLPNVVLR